MTRYLVKCECKNVFYDKKYGRSIRLHSRHYKPTIDKPVYICQLCGKLKMNPIALPYKPKETTKQKGNKSNG